MARIACLIVANFPIAALARADPDLIRVPLAVTEGLGARALVVAVSAAARAQGILPGRHTATQARTIATQVVLRRRDATIERSAADALCDVAASLSHRVEPGENGSVFLDAEGASHLVPTERGFTTALVTRAARVGLVARAGLGATKTVARLAAEYGDGTEVVAAATERGYLAPLPIECLHPDRTCAQTLAHWGVHRLGELARLPMAEVTTRLGVAGAALLRAARGEDEQPLFPHAPGGDIEERLDLEHPLDTIEPLLFVLRGLLERATARLELTGIGATRLGWTLTLEDRSRDVRTVPLLAPTRDVKTMLTLVRTHLEAHPPRAAISALAVALTPAPIRPVQLGLFTPPGPAPERLATTLARLAVLCGPERVGSPAVVDSHCPGRAAVVPFVPPARSLPPPNIPVGLCPLAVRVLRPPRPVDVFDDRGVPSYVCGDGLGGRVVEMAGPWRHTGEWWAETRFARDYYDLELSDGGLYRCFLDRFTRRWFVDGIYD